MLDFFGIEISVRKLVNSVIYVLFVFTIYLILRRILKIMFSRAGSKKMTAQHKQRVKTVSQMAASLLKYAMLILVLLVISADFGVNVTSLIAGLGVLTAVLGLAFQDMVKDIIAGTTIIVEGQFGISDIETEGIAYQLSCPCAAGDYTMVQSMMRESILSEFKKAKIEIPYQQVVVHGK